MLYFLLQPLLIYHGILIIAAVIPAIVLMVKAYRSDRLEKESPQILLGLAEAGVLAALLASLEENIGEFILSRFLLPEDPRYNVIMFFVIVAVSEESSKYLFMKRRSWNDREFNCQYDGVIYALFTSLGFALWENISYVLMYGFGTALIRAVTAIPGHASFGVFMGVFYGAAKKKELAGDDAGSRFLRFLAVLVPALMHGAYDYLATRESEDGSGYFLIFVILLFVVAFITVNKASKNDHYFGDRGDGQPSPHRQSTRSQV